MDKPVCIICDGKDMKLHFYPPNRFNNKEFNYYKCGKCSSLSIFPIPETGDFNQIYGVNDHSYLLDLSENQSLEFEFGYNKFDHQKLQIDFLKEALPLFKGKKLLDYACGSGFYMAYAIKIGLEPVGIEYSEDFVSLLRKKTKLNIYSLNEFREKYMNEKFDIIHLGHILEHMTNPRQFFNELKKSAHNNTLFIVDGPLENNTCLSRLVINMGAKLKKRKYNGYAPQHLSFTNYDSQLLFFNRLGMKKLKYKVVEQYWPLPDKPDWYSISSVFRHILGRCSIFLSGFFKKQGNVFHYIGKFE